MTTLYRYRDADEQGRTLWRILNVDAIAHLTYITAADDLPAFCGGVLTNGTTFQLFDDAADTLWTLLEERSEPLDQPAPRSQPDHLDTLDHYPPCHFCPRTSVGTAADPHKHHTAWHLCEVHWGAHQPRATDPTTSDCPGCQTAHLANMWRGTWDTLPCDAPYHVPDCGDWQPF